MDQKFGPPTSEQERKLFEYVLSEQQAMATDPSLEEIRKFISTLQINAEPPATLRVS